MAVAQDGERLIAGAQPFEDAGDGSPAVADAEARLRGGEDRQASAEWTVPDVRGLHGFAGDRAVVHDASRRRFQVPPLVPSRPHATSKQHGEDAGARSGFIGRGGEVGQRAAKLLERPRGESGRSGSSGRSARGDVSHRVGNRRDGGSPTRVWDSGAALMGVRTSNATGKICASPLMA